MFFVISCYCNIVKFKKKWYEFNIYIKRKFLFINFGICDLCFIEF